MQDAASADAEVLGIGYQALIADRKAFLLSHLHLELQEGLPSWGDELHLITWPRGTSGIMALRDFKGFRQDGSVFLKATSGWIVINVDERRPIRPSEVLANVSTVPDLATQDAQPLRLKPFSDGVLVDERVVRLSDLDPHSHVNNARYADWIIDACHSVAGSTVICPLRVTIDYLREVRLGQRVAISVKKQSSASVLIQGTTDRPCFVAAVALAQA